MDGESMEEAEGGGIEDLQRKKYGRGKEPTSYIEDDKLRRSRLSYMTKSIFNQCHLLNVTTGLDFSITFQSRIKLPGQSDGISSVKFLMYEARSNGFNKESLYATEDQKGPYVRIGLKPDYCKSWSFFDEFDRTSGSNSPAFKGEVVEDIIEECEDSNLLDELEDTKRFQTDFVDVKEEPSISPMGTSGHRTTMPEVVVCTPTGQGYGLDAAYRTNSAIYEVSHREATQQPGLPNPNPDLQENSSEVTRSDRRSRSKKIYTKEDLKLAIEELNKGKSLRYVCTKYGIPKSTLYDKKTGVHPRTERGPPTILGNEIEQGLANWIIESQNNGVLIDKENLKDTAAELAKLTGTSIRFGEKGVPGKGWIKRFLARHPQIVLRARAGARGKQNPFTAEKVRHHFPNLVAFGSTSDGLVASVCTGLVEPGSTADLLGRTPIASGSISDFRSLVASGSSDGIKKEPQDCDEPVVAEEPDYRTSLEHGRTGAAQCETRFAVSGRETQIRSTAEIAKCDSLVASNTKTGSRTSMNGQEPETSSDASDNGLSSSQTMRQYDNSRDETKGKRSVCDSVRLNEGEELTDNVAKRMKTEDGTNVDFTVENAAHKTEVRTDETFECEVCGSAYAQMNELKEHRRMHAGDQKCTFEFCDKSFARTTDRDRHVRTHTKPFQCTTCGKRFSQSGAHKTHVIKHHADNSGN